MTLFRRLALALATLSMSLTPAFVRACDMSTVDPLGYGDGGIISTPLSAKGKFIFVTKVSRRLLRQAVAERDKPLQDVLVRAEI